MKQRTFFDDEHAADLAAKRAVEPVDPNASENDKPRLRGQNAAILERLKVGPAMNHELCEISMRYSARINDLRNHGYNIASRDLGKGKWLYSLEGQP